MADGKGELNCSNLTWSAISCCSITSNKQTWTYLHMSVPKKIIINISGICVPLQAPCLIYAHYIFSKTRFHSLSCQNPSSIERVQCALQDLFYYPCSSFAYALPLS